MASDAEAIPGAFAGLAGLSGAPFAFRLHLDGCDSEPRCRGTIARLSSAGTAFWRTGHEFGDRQAAAPERCAGEHEYHHPGRHSSFGATSIPDVLQFVRGIDVRRYGVADVQVGIRGYNQQYNPRLLVLVNARQVYSDDFGRVAWPTIPVQLEEIRQIEVIKGPNSALYGFNAVSGVINILYRSDQFFCTIRVLSQKVLIRSPKLPSNAASLRRNTLRRFDPVRRLEAAVAPAGAFVRR
jgi:hypothetical protein